VVITCQKADADGRKWNGKGWSWVQKDVDALARLVEESGSPFDWKAIGRQLDPIRSADACLSMARKEGMTGRKVDADGRKRNGRGWSWIKKDIDALARLVSESGSPFDWEAIGGQMDPVRSAEACKSMASTEGMTGLKVDADGRKRVGVGWSWIKKDVDALARLVSESGSPFDWEVIGGQMNPIRGAEACRDKASKEGMTREVDADGRKWNLKGWSWIKKDVDALARLVSESGTPFDWKAIGGQMDPIRSAGSCQDMASKEGMTSRKRKAVS
jgi:hypothetical protein